MWRAMPAGQKEGGQALLGGLDCKVQRNFFGAQINSFESQLPVPKQLQPFEHGPAKYRAMFIRAPAIMEAGPSVEILSEYRWVGEARKPSQACFKEGRASKLPVQPALLTFPHGMRGIVALSRLDFVMHRKRHPAVYLASRLSAEEQAVTEGRECVAVAVRSKQLLATSFHPELTEELRWCVHPM